MARALEIAEGCLSGCCSGDIDLAQLDRSDGDGAVLLARPLDRLEEDGRRAGVVACGQGLLARGGASAVGARTTTAVVLAISSMIVISAVFTFFLTLIGI